MVSLWSFAYKYDESSNMQILENNEDCQYFQECLMSHVVVKGPRDNQWRRIKTLYKLFVLVLWWRVELAFISTI